MDLTKLSNEELLALSSKDKKKTEIQNLSNDELLKLAGREPTNSIIGSTKAAVSGISGGAIGLAGAPVDIATIADKYTGKALDYILPEWMGEARRKGRSNLGVSDTLGSTALKNIVQKHSGNVLSGKYEPKTKTESYLKTIGEFAPSAFVMPGKTLANLGMTTLAGIGSETGGQLTKGSTLEPYARLGGAIAGGLTPSIAKRIASPLPIGQDRKAMIDILKKENIPVTAGQATGNKPLQYTESVFSDMPFGGGKAAAIEANQAKAFTGAALKKLGMPDAVADPKTMTALAKQIGGKFDKLGASVTGIMDKKFAEGVQGLVTNYVDGSTNTALHGIVNRFAKVITDFSKKNGGKIPGAEYQNLRSRLLKQTRKPEVGDFSRDAIDILDKMMMRSAGLKAAKEWTKARRDWSNFKIIEKAASGAGEKAAFGLISPAQLRNAVKTNNPTGYTRGYSDLSELARAGNAVLAPLPQSGTGPRNLIQGLLTGGAIGAAGGNPAVIAGSIAAPAIAGRAVMSKPIQSFLQNQKFVSPEQQLIQRLLMSSRPDLMRSGGSGNQ